MIVDRVSNSGANNLSQVTSLSIRWRDWINRNRLDIGLPTVLLAISVALFSASIGRIELWKMNDLGLISVLPLTVFLAGLVLTASFFFCLSRAELRTPLLVLHILVLLFLLSGIAPFVEEVPRFNVTWRHAGIIEAITRLGRVFPYLDAYFNWPVFFVLSALVVKASGLQSALPLAPWAPVFFGLLYLGPLVMIFDSATRDRRLVWLGVWVFYLANWIGQDYLSPQALNVFLYLVLLGMLLRWFRTVGKAPRERREFPRLGRLAQPVSRFYAWLTAPETPSEVVTAGERKGLLGIWFLVFALVVSSHQLTPFAVLVSVIALVIFNRVAPRYLPLVMGAMIVAWMAFMAGPYVRGNLEKLISNVGQVGEAVSVNVTNRLGGSPGHALVVQMRLVMALGVWGLASVGFIRRFRKGNQDATYVLLAVAPFILLGLQVYGGEMLLRVYLFSLPFMAFFVAGLVFPEPGAIPSWRTLTAAGLISFLFLGGFYLTRYGNDKMEQFTAGEVEAVHYLYNVAEPGAVIASSSSHYPARFQDYEKYLTVYVPNETLAEDLSAIVSRMEYKKAPARYLILTRSQEAYLHLFYGMTDEAWDGLVHSLEASPRFRLVFSNQDAQVFLLVGK